VCDIIGFFDCNDFVLQRAIKILLRLSTSGMSICIFVILCSFVFIYHFHFSYSFILFYFIFLPFMFALLRSSHFLGVYRNNTSESFLREMLQLLSTNFNETTLDLGLGYILIFAQGGMIFRRK
jgi:hypothetical protein